MKKLSDDPAVHEILEMVRRYGGARQASTEADCRDAPSLCRKYGQQADGLFKAIKEKLEAIFVPVKDCEF